MQQSTAAEGAELGWLSLDTLNGLPSCPSKPVGATRFGGVGGVPPFPVGAFDGCPSKPGGLRFQSLGFVSRIKVVLPGRACLITMFRRSSSLRDAHTVSWCILQADAIEAALAHASPLPARLLRWANRRNSWGVRPASSRLLWMKMMLKPLVSCKISEASSCDGYFKKNSES